MVNKGRTFLQPNTDKGLLRTLSIIIEKIDTIIGNRGRNQTIKKLDNPSSDEGKKINELLDLLTQKGIVDV